MSGNTGCFLRGCLSALELGMTHDGLGDWRRRGARRNLVIGGVELVAVVDENKGAPCFLDARGAAADV